MAPLPIPAAIPHPHPAPPSLRPLPSRSTFWDDSGDAWYLLGSAVYESTNVFLTPAAGGALGAAVRRDAISLTTGFTLRINMTLLDRIGAGGAAFAIFLTNDARGPTALGLGGPNAGVFGAGAFLTPSLVLFVADAAGPSSYVTLGPSAATNAAAQRCNGAIKMAGSIVASLAFTPATDKLVFATSSLPGGGSCSMTYTGVRAAVGGGLTARLGVTAATSPGADAWRHSLKTMLSFPPTPSPSRSTSPSRSNSGSATPSRSTPPSLTPFASVDYACLVCDPAQSTTRLSPKVDYTTACVTGGGAGFCVRGVCNAIPAIFAPVVNSTTPATFLALIAFSAPGYSGDNVRDTMALAGKLIEGTNVTVGAYVRALIADSMQVPFSRATLTQVIVRDDAGNVYGRLDVSRDPAFNPNASAMGFAAAESGAGGATRLRRADLMRGARTDAAEARALQYIPPVRFTNSRLVFNVMLTLTITDVVRTGGYEKLPLGQTMPLEAQIYNRISAAAPTLPIFAALVRQWDAFTAVNPMADAFKDTAYIESTFLVSAPPEIMPPSVAPSPVGSSTAAPFPYWCVCRAGDG